MKKSTIVIIVVAILIIGGAIYYFASGPRYTSAPAANYQAPANSYNAPSAAANLPAATAPKPTPGATREVVTIQNFSFNPKTITVKAGSTIGWINSDGFTHTVTSDSFTGGSISSGGTLSVVFNDAGTFNYHCSIHPSMTGTIIVTK